MTGRTVLCRRAAGLLSRNSGGGMLLAVPDGTGVEWLSPSASLVWDSLEEPCTQEELVVSVAELAGQTPDRVEESVAALLRRLRARGLITDVAS